MNKDPVLAQWAITYTKVMLGLVHNLKDNPVQNQTFVTLWSMKCTQAITDAVSQILTDGIDVPEEARWAEYTEAMTELTFLILRGSVNATDALRVLSNWSPEYAKVTARLSTQLTGDDPNRVAANMFMQHTDSLVAKIVSSLVTRMSANERAKRAIGDHNGHPVLKKTWTDEDLEIIQASQITNEDTDRWKRGNIPVATTAPTTNEDTLDIEVIDVKTHYVPLWKTPVPHTPTFLRSEGTASVPSLAIYGRTPEGRSVCAHVWNYHPYFFVRSTQRLTDAKTNAHAARDIASYLEPILDNERKYTRAQYHADQADAMEIDDEDSDDGYTYRRNTARKDPGPCVMRVEPVERMSATDCRVRPWSFFKVTLRTPNMIKKARDTFQLAPDPTVHVGPWAIDRITYEASVLFENRFMIDRDIIGGGWARADTSHCEYRTTASRKTTTCDVELDIDYTHIQGYSMAEDTEGRFDRPSAIRVCSYDLECGARPGKFPDAKIDPIIQIGVDYWSESNHDATERLIFVLGSCTPIRGARVLCYTTERDMLNAFGQFMRYYDPDVLTGYNILGFDNAYLYDRSEITNAKQLLYSTRNSDVEVRSREVFQQSRNTGNRKHFEVTFEGRVCYDLLPFIADGHKLRSYTLNNVSKHFLGDQKEDMDYNNILPLFLGSADDRRTLAIYCIKDATLPKLLARKLLPVQQMIEFARVTGVQLRQIQGQGSSVKVMTAVLRACRKRNVVMPYQPDQPKRVYQGALVAEPKPGFYVDPVSVLDFSSLYPSIMIAHNLSFDTHVPPDLVGIFDPNDLETCPEGHTYIKRSVRTGILTEVLENLLALRSMAKRAMADAAAAGDMLLKMVYNCRQLAIKVLANSVYGWTGLSTSVYFWYCAASCTAYGRIQITLTKDLVEEKFTIANGYPADAKCVYGDSVTGDTPIWVRYGGVDVHLVAIEYILPETYTSWRSDTKQQIALQPDAAIEVWSEKGWTTLRRVIRHSTTKPIYRITTHTGSVCVTEDHSLLRPDGSEVTPHDVVIGSELLHSPLPGVGTATSDTITSTDEAYAMGLFFADGSCGRYGEGSRAKSTWAINKANRALLEDVRVRLSSLPEVDRCKCSFKILDTLASSGVYKLVAQSSPSLLVKRYRPMFYDPVTATKVVPRAILSAGMPVREAFWAGYYAGDGDKTGPGKRCDIKGQIGAAGMFSLLRGIGYKVSINVRSDKPDIYRLTVTRGVQRRPVHAIKKIEKRPVPTEPQWVYDLETDNHHFAAGVGELVVHNTDSVMVQFGIKINGPDMLVDCSDARCRGGKLAKCPIEECKFGKKASPATLAAIAKTIELSVEAGAYCTEYFAKPNKLEFENVYWPYLLLDRKKRYAGPFWTNAEAPSYTKVRGLESERRDNCPMASEAQTACLNAILYELDPEKAVNIVKQTIRNLRSGKTDMRKLIISNRLNARQNDMTASERRAWKAKGGTHYKDECTARGVYSTLQPHAQLDYTMQKRTGKGYNLNDRVPYVIVNRALQKGEDKVYKKAEDPIYALAHDMSMDLEYYTKQVVACTANVLAPVYEHKLVGKAQGSLTDVYSSISPSPSKRSRPPELEEVNPRPMKRISLSSPAPKASRQTGIASFFTGATKAPRFVEDVQSKRRATKVRARAHEKVKPFGWRTKAMLLAGPHMTKLNLRREISLDAPSSSTLSSFVQSQCQCIGCGYATARGVYICAQCRPRQSGLIDKYLTQYTDLNKTCTAAWKTCHVCQLDNQKEFVGEEATEAAKAQLSLKDGHEDEGLSECKAIGCENFFHRTTTKRSRDRMRDVADALRTLSI